MKLRTKIARALYIDKFVKWLGLYGTLDTEKALRAKQERIRRLEQEVEQMRGFTVVHVDPTVYHNPFKTGAYDAPSPTTDGKIAVQGARYRSFLRQLQEQDPGTLLHHHNGMQKKAQTVKLDPETMILPSVTAPEDDWTNGGIDKTARHQATKP